MQVIEVEANPGPDGACFPRSFVYQGQHFQVDSIGRRWQAEDGEHVLVMIQPNDRVFELVYARDIWHLKRGYSAMQAT